MGYNKDKIGENFRTLKERAGRATRSAPLLHPAVEKLRSCWSAEAIVKFSPQRDKITVKRDALGRLILAM